MNNHPSYFTPTLLSIESILMYRLILLILINVIQPIPPSVIRAAADNGANIDAISGVDSSKHCCHCFTQLLTKKNEKQISKKQ